MARKLAAGLTLLALSLFAGACGDEDKETGGQAPKAEQPTTASFEMTGRSEKQLKMTGPASVEAGLVKVVFKNSAKGEHGVQLIRIEGSHTAAEALKRGEAWGDKGKALPEWITLEGGVTTTPEGESFAAVQNLAAGKYVAFDLDTNQYTEFEVTGSGAGEELPAAAGRIQAVDYSFTSSGLKAGKQTVEFANTGKEPHFAVGVRIKPGKTIADVREYLKTEKGEEPVIEKDMFGTGVIDGGRKQVIDIQLKKGSYALLCFVPDRKGGPPHAFKGMISEAVVE